MDRETASKVRALTLASRCLARELKTIRGRAVGVAPETPSLVETERLVGLARVILDPGEQEAELSKTQPGALLGALDVEVKTSGHASEGAPSPHHILGLSGHGTVLPIPELIGFLAQVGKTGILRILTASDRYVLEFLAGDIVHGEASSVPEGQRVGDLLVAAGAIERPILEAACGEESDARIGQTLIERKLIDKTQLSTALQKQIQGFFNRVFREEAKSFTFWSGPPICAAEGVRLNTTSLLLEGARASDEAEDSLRAESAKTAEEPA